MMISPHPARVLSETTPLWVSDLGSSVGQVCETAWWERPDYRLQQFYAGAYEEYKRSGWKLDNIFDIVALTEYRLASIKRAQLVREQKKIEKLLEVGFSRNLETKRWACEKRIEQNQEYLSKLKQKILANNPNILERISWKKLTHLPANKRSGRHHWNSRFALTGNWTNHPLVFLPATRSTSLETHLTADPSGPTFAEHRRCLSIKASPTVDRRDKEYLFFVTPHPGIVPWHKKPKGFPYATIHDLQMAKSGGAKLDDFSKLKVELKEPGFPVIGMGRQTLRWSGVSLQGKTRPQSFCVDLNRLNSPIYWNVADQDQLLTWFGHWRYITAATAAIRNRRSYSWFTRLIQQSLPTEEEPRGFHSLLFVHRYSPNEDQWSPISSCDGFSSSSWKLLEVREELSLVYQEHENDGSVVVPRSPDVACCNSSGEDFLLYSPSREKTHKSWFYKSPKLRFEIVRYGLYQSPLSPNELRCVPVGLKHTNGWYWRIDLDVVTDSFCDQLSSFVEETFKYICRDGDSKFSNLTWFNKRRLLYPFPTKSASLREHEYWNHHIKPHLPLFRIQEERSLWEEKSKGEEFQIPYKRVRGGDKSFRYERGIELLSINLLRFYEPEWKIKTWDRDHDPQLTKKLRKRGLFLNKAEWKEKKASDLSIWSQVHDDILKVKKSRTRRLNQVYGTRDGKRVSGPVVVDLHLRNLELSKPPVARTTTKLIPGMTISGLGPRTPHKTPTSKPSTESIDNLLNWLHKRQGYVAKVKLTAVLNRFHGKRGPPKEYITLAQQDYQNPA